MAQLTVRNLPDHVVAALERRARERGVSAEEEHRRILIATLLDDGFVDFLLSMPSGDDGPEPSGRQSDLPRDRDARSGRGRRGGARDVGGVA